MKIGETHQNPYFVAIFLSHSSFPKETFVDKLLSAESNIQVIGLQIKIQGLREVYSKYLTSVDFSFFLSHSCMSYLGFEENVLESYCSRS